MKDCTIVTFLLYLLAVLAICAAQSSPTHIYDGDNVIAVEAAGGPISCANTMLMLKNDPTQTSCFAMLNSTYGVVDLGCPEELVGATQLACAQGFNALSCWALNPTTNSIVAIWQNQVVGSVDLTGLLTTPKVFSVMYDQSYDMIGMIIVDAADNKVWTFLVAYPFGDDFISQVTPTVAVGNVTSVVLYDTTEYDTGNYNYLLVSDGDTTISQYNILEALPQSTFGTFGHLKSLAVDAYDSIYAVDSACSCIRKVDFTGSVQRTINGISTHVKKVALNRRKTFVVDDTGIWKYEEEHVLQASLSMINPITCDGQAGSMSIQVDGQGDYPFSVLVIPDCITRTFNAPGNTTIPISINPLQAYETLILDDELNRNFQLNGLPLAGRGFYNNTVIPGGAKFGNYSYGWKFTPGNPGFAVWSGGMQTSQFEWFEFWLNIGLGGQKFTFQLNPSPELITINPGDLKLNTWYQYRLSFPYYLFKRQSSNANTGFGSLQIMDLNKGPNQNMIYIDGVKIIPYANKFPARTAFMYDACGLSIDPIPVPFVYEPLKVTIKGKPVSCNVNTTTAQNLAYNGELEAIVQNGQAPYFYNWSYSPLNQSVVTGFPILNSWITVYDNQLNKSWVDISIGDTYNLNETSVYHSAPSSISFTVTNEGQGLIFQVSPEIDMHDYDTLEFWANGGPIGGQTFSIYLLRSTSGAVVQTTSFPTASNMVSLPPNQWVKMSFTLPVSTILNKDAKYNLVEIVSTVPNNPLSPAQPYEQPILYLDDIILIGKSVLTVTDNRGCKVSTQYARIVTPPAITQTINVNHAKCFNNTDGIVNVLMTGGVAPFDFVWGDSDTTTETLYNLGEGFVYVNATDSNECTFKPAVATVLQPPPITLELNITQPKCYGGIGLATASAYGGSGTFTYNWLSSSAIAQTIPSPNPEAIFLDALTFPLHTDYASIVCRGTGTHLNMDIAPTHSGYCTLSLNPVPAQPSTEIRGCQACFNKGRYDTVSFWIFTDVKEVLEDFYITMSQDNVKSNFSIPITTVLNVEVHKWQQVIFHLDYFSDLQSPDGIAWITRNVSHFEGTVLVDDVVAFPRISNGAGYGALPGYISTMQVKAADYFVSLVDGNGCSSITKVVVPQPDQINITYTSSSPTFQDGNDGKIKVTVNGGTPPYTYHWLEINLTTENIENVVYGAYVLQVTDAHGCVAELNAYINPYIPVVEVTVRKYNANLSSGLAALVSVGFIICLFSGTMLFRYWASFSVLGSFLSTMILFGCVLSFLSALVLLPEPTDALCQSFIWFLGVGFALVYGCLFIKTWALYKVWRNAVHYHKAALTPLYIVKCLGLVVTIEVIFLAIWTAIDPPKVHLVKSLNNTLERQCNTNNMTFWIIFLVGKGAWLIFGAVLSVLTKNIAKEYNESSSIAYAIYNNVLLGAIAIPLAILLKEVPGGRLTVEVVIITIAFSFTLVVIFFKIWHNIILPDKIPMGREMRKNRNTASSTGSIKSNSGERQSKGSPTLSASASVSTVNLRDGELSEA